jgi:hypothetical protein
LPDFTPLRNDVLLIGKIAGIGGSTLGFPIICLKRRKPVEGREEGRVAFLIIFELIGFS